jgi:hypothetical protein
LILGLAPVFAGGAIIATRAVRTWKRYHPRPPLPTSQPLVTPRLTPLPPAPRRR